ncbi:MAG: shikimate dehydrogenase [Bacteroidales bacterium]|nr:shikimate dehydrogenase [Bacteroidales bacterium]
MKKFGLIGFPLEVSFSKDYFLEKFEHEKLNNCTYELYPIADISEFPEFLKTHADLCGLNVTIPYKKTVIPYLDGLDDPASEAGAVNVIKFEKDGKLIGYNSDVFGFEQSFLPLLRPHHRSALIFGTGGSATAVASVLRKHKIPYQFVSRQKTSEALTYQDLHHTGFGEATILINTTPFGMMPNIDTCADLPYEKITSDFLCYDLVYTSAETLFLQKSKAQGAMIKNGLEMLHLQADQAWDIWQS